MPRVLLVPSPGCSASPAARLRWRVQSQPARQAITVVVDRRRVHARRRRRLAAGRRTFAVKNNGRRGHRGLRLPRTGPHRRRAREHRPRAHPEPDRRAQGRQLRDRLQARHERRRHPRGRSTSPAGERGHERHDAAALTKAAADYRGYVQAQAAELLAATTAFVAAVKAGDIDKAKKATPPSRDRLGAHRAGRRVLRRPRPAVDVREDDLEAGQDWTGWHRLEKALWVDELPRRHGPRRRPAPRGPRRSCVTKVGTAEITPTRWPTAPRSCSTRSPPARSPARRSATPTPTCRLPGQRRGRQEGLRAAEARVAAEGRGPRARTLDTRSRRCRPTRTATQVGDGFALYTDADRRPGARLSAAGQRAGRAPVQARRQPSSQ